MQEVVTSGGRVFSHAIDTQVQGLRLQLKLSEKNILKVNTAHDRKVGRLVLFFCNTYSLLPT